MLRLLSFLIIFPALVRAQALSDEQVVRLRERIRSNFFIASPLPALNAQTHRRFEPASDVSAEAVTYATADGMKVTAILYLPNPLPPNIKLPGFIVVNGHGGDKFCWYSYFAGITYARAGAAVLTYDQAGEGERNKARKSGTRAHDAIKGDATLARHLCGLMLTDVMQAVSCLAARPEVDASRIGAAGYSLGSFVMSLAGAIEPRLKACVMVGGGNLDGPEGYWDKSKPMCQALPYRSLSFLGDRAATIYALHAARGPSLLWNGRKDTVVNMQNTQEAFFDDLRQRVTKLRGTTASMFETGFVDEASHRPYFLTKPVALWLERQLDFPNWTPSSIAAMPETHISEWAAQQSIAMDKLYATEEREGGVRAVGDHVPGYRRDDLSVFTASDWEAHKQELSIDAWVEKMKP